MHINIICYSNQYGIWFFKTLDFTDSIDDACDIKGYKKYVPGLPHYSCYRGMKDMYYKRNHENKCLSMIYALPPLSPTKCRCQQNDYTCQFQFKMVNKKCVVDTDLENFYILNKCEFGKKYYSKAIKHKPEYNKCYLNYDEYQFYTFRVCHADEKINFISYRNSKGIFYYPFEKYNISAKFPLDSFQQRPIFGYDIDVLSRAIFYTTDEGLYRYIWGDNQNSFDEKYKLNDRFYDNAKIRFDNIGKLLYISDYSGIYISAYPYYEYTLITENIHISNFDIISEIGILIYTIKIKEKFKLYFCDMLGNKIFERHTRSNFVYPFYNSDTGFLKMIFEIELIEINLETMETIYKKIDRHDKLLEFHIYGYKYIITKTSLIYDGNIINPNMDGIEYRVHLKNTYFSNICTRATCSHYCIIKSGSYKCGCPEYLNLYNSNQCAESTPETIYCPKDKFLCDINQCIDNFKKCDSIFDCLDQSDEKNCNFNDKNCFFKCGDLCIDNNKICDGHLDCFDGSDENGCDKTDHCHSPFKIKCKDENRCYSHQQICDDYYDCSFGSDEINCQNKENLILNKTCESPFYVKFQNSSCIPIYKYCTDSDKVLNTSNISLCDNEVQDIEFKLTNESSGVLKWSTKNKIENNFIIEIYDWDNLALLNNYTTKNNYQALKNLEICKRYLIIVHTSINFGRSLQLSTFDIIKPPTNITFNEDQMELSWSIDIFCIPYVFYVVCVDFEKKSMELFVKENKIILNSKYIKCSVASCHIKKYNSECSNFESLSIFKENKNNLVEILIVIMLIILVFQILLIIKNYKENVLEYINSYKRNRYVELDYQYSIDNFDFSNEDDSLDIITTN